MANNKIAFGLCEQHNIKLPKDATPRDTWEALKERGIVAGDDSSAKSSSIVPGKHESPNLEQSKADYDINSLTQEIESDISNASQILRRAIADGKVNTHIHKGHQDKHILGTQNYRQEIANGREPSILTADANILVKKHVGKGQLVFTRRNKWTQKERFIDDGIIGIYKNKRFSSSHKTRIGNIHYGNGGVHIVPEQEKKYDKSK